MEIREILDKNAWEDFFAGLDDKSFLQSWAWGEFHQRLGRRIWRLGMFEKNELLSVALVARVKARRGTYLLCQHGPAFLPAGASAKEGAPWASAGKTLQLLKIWKEKLKEIAREEKATFARINPLLPASRENQEVLTALGFRLSPLPANAYTDTWKLDLLPDEEELLRNMRKTTRYLIRQALAKSDLSCEKSCRPEDVDAFQKLNEAVSRRQNFTSFPLEHVRNEFAVFSADNQALWFFGRKQEQILAGALVIFWSGVAFYHQAASLGQAAKLPLPYLIQWEAIREARKRGCRFYDFWGFVDPQKQPGHPWAGPTLFKMGFGGQEYHYTKTQDLVFSRRYWLTYAFEKIVQIKRHL